MPNEPINKKQLKAVDSGVLTREELDRGYRARPAWQVELMSKGKQVVLQPTVHVDTKKAYLWNREMSE